MNIFPPTSVEKKEALHRCFDWFKNYTCFKNYTVLFEGNKTGYLFYFLKYLCKLLVDRQAPSLDVTTKISPGAQTVLGEEHRESLQSLQHLLKAQKGHYNVVQSACSNKCLISDNLLPLSTSHGSQNGMK